MIRSKQILTAAADGDADDLVDFEPEDAFLAM